MPKDPDPSEAAALEALFHAEFKGCGEQFRAQLIRVIDERVAIALEKRFPVTLTTAGDGNHPNPFSATNTAGTFYAMERPLDVSGMRDPRSDPH